jgi:hypothetical protein
MELVFQSSGPLFCVDIGDLGSSGGLTINTTHITFLKKGWMSYSTYFTDSTLRELVAYHSGTPTLVDTPALVIFCIHIHSAKDDRGKLKLRKRILTNNQHKQTLCLVCYTLPPQLQPTFPQSRQRERDVSASRLRNQRLGRRGEM